MTRSAEPPASGIGRRDETGGDRPQGRGLPDRLRTLFEIGAHPLTLEAITDLPALPGTVVQRLTFRTSAGASVRGVLCRPVTDAPGPVVLVIHAHGNRYDIGADELMQGRPALTSPPGPAFARLGFATLCLDMPCFGDRATETESAAAKRALWGGRSLAGQMLGENASALDWLAAQDWVRADRIGVFGISMGATLGYWLAAVDPRVAVLAHQCCLADFGALIASGAHDLHGIYLTVPGLPALASNGVLAGMVAPRPQFIGLGAQDPLTPPEALGIALDEVRAAYAAQGGNLVVHLEPDEGHRETPAMRAALLAFMARELA
jgi:dienelactone hydrolase